MVTKLYLKFTFLYDIFPKTAHKRRSIIKQELNRRIIYHLVRKLRIVASFTKGLAYDRLIWPISFIPDKA